MRALEMPCGGAEPFLKWPGGKRWAAGIIAELTKPHLVGTYIEPFLGGGAVFFRSAPRRAVLADINPDLIDTYRAVRRRYHSIVQKLRQLRVSKDDYYRIRESEPDDPADRAARFLYLNRTSFGGIYRLNREGKFNVPYGGGERTHAVLCNSDLLKQASLALSRADLRVSDFAPIIDLAERGDVVYCDPTYTVAHDDNGFVRYNNRNFSWHDQERLATSAFRVAKRGAFVVISNAHHGSIKQLYKGAQFIVLQRASTVTPVVERRTRVSEYLIYIKPTKDVVGSKR